MYYLLTGEFPFKGENESETYDKIINGKFNFNNKLFSNISFEAKDLMKKCFIYKPQFRISAKDALEHSFFKTDKEIELDNSEILSSSIYLSSDSKFFKSIFLFLICNSNCYKDELIKIKDTFYSVNVNKDGKISKNELFNIIEKLGNDKLKIDDLNNDFFSLFDIVKLIININEIFNEENLKNAFKIFDLNNNIKIPEKDISEIIGLENIKNREIILLLLKEINKTEYDEFTFDEFKLIIEKSIQN